MLHSLKTKITLYFLLFSTLWIPRILYAVAEKETEVRPDGTTVTRETITYYPPETEIISHSVIIGIVAIFGGLIALLGIKLILKALDLGHHDGTAEIAINLSTKNLKFKKLAQGVVITSIGAAIMLGALYFLTL